MGRRRHTLPAISDGARSRTTVRRASLPLTGTIWPEMAGANRAQSNRESRHPVVVGPKCRPGSGRLAAAGKCGLPSSKIRSCGQRWGFGCEAWVYGV
jgi:hypothetical protein